MNKTEKWYMLQIDDSKKVMGDLIKLGIPCDSITNDSKKTSITFPSSYKNQVFGYLGIQSKEYSLDPTGIENLFTISFIPDDIDETTPPPDKNFEGWNEIIPVIQGVKNSFNVKIIPSNPHGNPREPTECSSENILYVYFWSTPEPSERIHLQTVFGVILEDGQKDAFKPVNSWSVIRDESGTVVAEYLNNNLYILFDLPHARGEGVTEMFTRIMKAYFEIKGRGEGELANFYHSIRGEGASSKSAFVKSCSKIHAKKLKGMEETLKTRESEINKLNEQLVSVIRDKEILETAIEPLKKSVDDRRKIAENEYDILMATPHVKDVVAVGDTIHIFTDMITIRNDGDDYNIGEFRIDIHTGGGNSGVRAYNLTRVKKPDGETKVHHPHIKGEGYCCLGNISHGITKLLADYQYVILGQSMINFLHSYNKDSAYLFIKEWG